MRTSRTSRGRNLSILCSVLSIFAAIALSGCGEGPPNLGDPIAVKGTVTMDGAPAANVDVTFSRSEGKAAPEDRQFIAHTNANGEFTIPKIFEGTYQVMVVDPVEAKEREEKMAAVETGKYAKYGTASELTAKVDKSSTDFKFDLTSN